VERHGRHTTRDSGRRARMDVLQLRAPLCLLQDPAMAAWRRMGRGSGRRAGPRAVGSTALASQAALLLLRPSRLAVGAETEIELAGGGVDEMEEGDREMKGAATAGSAASAPWTCSPRIKGHGDGAWRRFAHPPPHQPTLHGRREQGSATAALLYRPLIRRRSSSSRYRSSCRSEGGCRRGARREVGRLQVRRAVLRPGRERKERGGWVGREEERAPEKGKREREGGGSDMWVSVRVVGMKGRYKG
jgi:hypothetical protein